MNLTSDYETITFPLACVELPAGKYTLEDLRKIIALLERMNEVNNQTMRTYTWAQ